MRSSLFALILVGVMMAGCVDDARSDPEDAAPPPPSPPAGVGPGAPPGDPMGAEASVPVWQPGDGWRWSVRPRDSQAYEATTVVARTTGDTYEVGWASAEEGLRSQFFHFVPSGIVQAADLSWEAHHEPVDWLDFPLWDGKVWQGDVWVTELTFTATAATVASPQGPAPGFRVHGTGDDDGVRVEMEWASDLNIFTSMRFFLYNEAPWLELVLLESWLGSSDPVHMLHSELVMARFTGLEHDLLQAHSPPPALEPLEVPEGTTHVSMGCYLGGAPGYYAYRFTDSGGTAYDCEVHGTEDWFGLLIEFGPVAAGTSVSNFVTAGQGTVFVELYFVTDEVVTPG